MKQFHIHDRILYSKNSEEFLRLRCSINNYLIPSFLLNVGPIHI